MATATPPLAGGRITGGGGGIGRATAERLAGAGWTVYASARQPESIEAPETPEESTARVLRTPSTDVATPELFAEYQRGGAKTETLPRQAPGEGILTAGDRVTIHMPMVAELPITMLACARLGVIHSVVFGGFSSVALADRILVLYRGTIAGERRVEKTSVEEIGLLMLQGQGEPA